MTSNAKTGLIIFILVAATVTGLVAGAFAWVNWHSQDAKTPLQWCVWEIYQHYDNSEEYFWSYEEANPVEMGEKAEKSYTGAYCITFGTDGYISLWLGIINCQCNHILKNIRLENYAYRPDEVIWIDCDIIYEMEV